MRWFSSPIVVLVLACVVRVGAADVPDDWAYQPVAKPAVPPGAVHPVDAFVHEKLRAAKITPAPAASKSALLRRVTYDLTGLPPTLKELADFEQDTSPKAYEKVVNRLLASPHFGERMATWWLDLARYAETDGFNADGARPNAWRYRDYVIQSFNKDKPYDRFVQEQIAGDELFPNDPQAIVATGFLRHFPDEYNAVNIEQRRQEILNDITDTTTATFLGITVGCAKCHDHKTDPILQEDYYRMQAFFAGYWPTETSLLSAAQQAEYDRKLAAWEQKTAKLREQIAEIEAPIREKGAMKERSRFDEDYASLIDLPTEQRTPLQKQLAAMVERQVYSARKFSPSQIKGEAKTKWEALTKELAQHEKEKPAEPPMAMAMTDVSTVPPAHYKLRRGDWRKPGDEVNAGFILSIDDRLVQPKPTKTTSGRRSELARWMTTPDNRLTSRVIVNRIWQHLFERGIVASTSDFGLTGDKPTHPELLDWLATNFVQNGWSMKKMFRLLLTSATYQRTSQSESGDLIDPENLLLWRAPRKRLDGETTRDAILRVSGTLNLKTGGPGIYPELPPEIKGQRGWKPSPEVAERYRRSIYVSVQRNMRYPFFTLFDAPDRNETCARRFVTTTAPQSLMLMNDTLILDFAKKFAERVQKEAGDELPKQIDHAFLLALSRRPTEQERMVMTKFLKTHPGTSVESLTDLCHSILNLNEFLYVD